MISFNITKIKIYYIGTKFASKRYKSNKIKYIHVF
jgi:hypothetical protein